MLKLPKIAWPNPFKVIPIAHLYCARFERVHVHNERNFPQAKLDSEMFFFILNEHGDLNFYRIITVYMLSSLTKDNKIYRKRNKT